MMDGGRWATRNTIDDEAPAGAGLDPLQEWELLAQGQSALFRRIAQANVELTKQVEDLKSELSLHKAGWVTLTREKCSLAADISRLEKTLNTYQNDRSRIVCVIDGDGAIFHEDLITKGKEGGREAADLLCLGITQYFDAMPTSHPGANGSLNSTPANRAPRDDITAINILIVLNVKGLAATLAHNGICSAADLDQFVLGFNQAAPLCTIVDIGWDKEAADAKLKENLLFFSQLHQTRHVVFGGVHDKSHLSILKALQIEGVLDKIVILHGSRKMSYETYKFIKETNLSMMEVMGIFLQQKLIPAVMSPKTNMGVITPPLARQDTPGSLRSPLGTPMGYAEDSDEASVSMESSRPRYNVSSPSARQAPSWRSSYRVPQFGLHEAHPPAGISPDLGYTPAVPSTPVQDDSPGSSLYIDPTKPLTKQRPALCNFYYLYSGKCLNGENCRYSHQYNLTPSQLESYRNQVKTLPCLNLLSNNPCPKGDDCMMGHVCPHGTQCKYYVIGKCKFRREGMHPMDLVPE